MYFYIFEIRMYPTIDGVIALCPTLTDSIFLIVHKIMCHIIGGI